MPPAMPHIAAALKVPDLNQSPTEWARKNITLSPRESARPGPFNPDLTPYTKKILDCCADPYVEEITFVGSTQTGKTRTPLNAVAYWLDNQPGDVLWNLPDEKMAGRFARRRFKPMIESQPVLQKYRTGRTRDEHKLEFYFNNSTVSFAWSNSPAALSSFPVPYIVNDEIDKFPSQIKNEADPLSLARERTAWFWYRKILNLSSPTIPGSNVDRCWDASAKHLFHVPCPHCGIMQPLEFGSQTGIGGLKWPDDERNPAKIAALQMAWYECGECAGRIDEHMKFEVIRAGEYRCVAGDPSSRHVGFRINALYSPARTFSEVAAQFLLSKDDPIKLQNFKNSWLAENWEQCVVTVKREKLHAAAVGGVKRGSDLPNETQLLTAGVDVHGAQKGFYWSVWAWAYGRKRWLIDYGQCFNRLDLMGHLRDRQWKTADGKYIYTPFIGVDSGWGETSAEVYELVRPHYPQWQATKGMQSLAGLSVRETSLDYQPARGGRRYVPSMSGTMALLLINTGVLKDELANLLSFDTEEESGRMLWLCSDVGEDFLRSLGSEQKVRIKGKEIWKKVYEGAPNHLWDTAIIARAVAERRGLFRLAPPDPVEHQKAMTAVQKPTMETGRSSMPGGRYSEIRRH